MKTHMNLLAWNVGDFRRIDVLVTGVAVKCSQWK